MCIATAGLLIGGLGAATSAIGTLNAGSAAAAQAAYQARVAQTNAQIKEQDASRAMAAGEQQASTAALKGAGKVAQIKAGQAANGVDVNSGSALDVQTSQREENELSTSNTLNNAALQVYGYRVGASSDAAQSGLENMAAANDKSGAELSAAGGLLSTAGTLGSKYAQGGGSFSGLSGLWGS